MATRAYAVTVEAKYPAYGQRPEVREVQAANAREAEALVRREIERGGWSYRTDGALRITARRSA